MNLAQAERPPRTLLLRAYAITVCAGLFAFLPPHRLRRLLVLRRPGQNQPNLSSVIALRNAVDHIQRSGWPLVRRGCLTRGLSLFWLLRQRGVAGLSLAFGVGPLDAAPVAHCWLIRDGAPYLEATDPTETFTEVWRIDEQAHQPDLADLRFEIGRIGVSVSTTDPTIREAVWRRLKMLRSSETGGSAITVEYRRESPSPETDAGRPIYDSELGSVQYLEDRDEIVFAGAGFDFRCVPREGFAEGRIDVNADRADWLASRPLLTLSLLELLKRNGVFGLHAAAVAIGGKAVVIAGASGSGKSTLALSLGLNGFTFLGDDLVLLRPNGGQLELSALYEELDLTEWTVSSVDSLRTVARPPTHGWPKYRVDPADVFGDVHRREVLPGLVLFPRADSREHAHVRPLPAPGALTRLAPDILLTDRAAVSAHLAAVGRLVDASRCYELFVGSPTETAALVQTLI